MDYSKKRNLYFHYCGQCLKNADTDKVCKSCRHNRTVIQELHKKLLSSENEVNKFKTITGTEGKMTREKEALRNMVGDLLYKSHMREEWETLRETGDEPTDSFDDFKENYTYCSICKTWHRFDCICDCYGR